jgi:hypothetical protein
MKTNRDDIINDVGNGLADIRGMAILAIRTAEGLSKASHSRDPEADESLSFALHDILTRIEKLSDGLGGDQIRAAWPCASPTRDRTLQYPARQTDPSPLGSKRIRTSGTPSAMPSAWSGSRPN